MSTGPTYADALQQLAALGPELSPSAAPRKFDLAHMRALLSALGDPQQQFDSVLIAGTNGKGSTAATLASILAAAGYRTALYTSPHLVRVNERMQLSAPIAPTEYSSADVPATLGPAELLPISNDDFARLYFRVDEVASQLVDQRQLPHSPSFFERLTALAFLWFAERQARIAILEVGLGGRLDATNVVEPLLSVITDIALDHQEYLGSTLAAITREKAGILRPTGILITLPQHPEVNQALGEIAAALPQLRAISAAAFIPPATRHAEPAPMGPPATLAPNHYLVEVDSSPLEVNSPLPGHHQQRNLALAISAATNLSSEFGYKISSSTIETGIQDTRWPGRLELLPLTDGRDILLDVAHNPAGAWTLRSAIAQLPSGRPRTLLFSCLRDKDLAEMAQILFPLFDSTSTDPERCHDHLIFAPITSTRAAPVEDLLAQAHRLDIPAHAAPHLHAAFSQAQAVTPAGGIILATGSVYLVGELRQLILSTPPPSVEPLSITRPHTA